ncbi:alpha/beta hydrolase [Actinocrispum wychmicini]|uniref:S-formylglutathione hydrolase FrmB n=1 Tax=Actinocrispum wychmicini TaxID=1213861 RepID=A0A4R2IHD7_9PSEU|nr:alpha/beta hydrolase-fold protein [Actinocrispum wychmicini]TCO44244.1 S-formylglutathione hydrolase FrmB [Actinocrispum wychmicini]
MGEILDWELVHGPVPAVLTALGAVAGLSLLVRRDRRWWLRVVPFVAGVSVLVTVGLNWVVDDLWQPFPDALPLRVLYWVGAAVFAIGLAIAGMPRIRWWRRGTAVLAVLLVIGTATIKINAVYGYYPTLRAALGMPPPNEVAFASINVPAPIMPAHGAVTQVAIPSPESKFPARNAYLYVPPAYQAVPRPSLPVLVLIPGQPGAPQDWVNGGQVADIMDRFAATHNGVAPIVVIPDATGGGMNNPLCADTKAGNAETYLTKDVPAWIRQNLQVVPNRWAVAGFSYGGTCSLQLALRHPDVYPLFVDISGQEEPTLGSRERTIREGFGGDEAAFRRINPADLLATGRFPGTAGVFTVGIFDKQFKPQQRKMLDLSRRAGMDVQSREVTGGHDWRGWSGGLDASMDWLAARMGLVTA